MQSVAHEIDWLKTRISQDPASMFYARLADRYLHNNEVDQAVEYAEKGALLHPHDVTARFVLAKCCYVKQDFEKTDKNLAEVLTLEPRHLGALDLQAELLRDRGDSDLAKEKLDQLITIDPFNDAIYQKVVDLRSAPATPRVDESTRDDWDIMDETRLTDSKFDVHRHEDFELELDREPESSEIKDDSLASQQIDSLQDDPFADFIETTPLDDHRRMDEEPPEDLDKAEPAPHDAPGEEFEAEHDVDQDYRGEELLDESIEDDFEIDRSKFREEKSKFTRLLDDIFSSSLDEEEQREHEQRTAIERLADEDNLLEEPPNSAEPFQATSDDSDFEPLLSRDEIVSPEEKILESDRKQHDDFYQMDEQLDAEPDEDDELFHQPKDDIQEQATEAPKSRNDDFSSFLDSLDIQEESTSQKEFPHDFDDPVPNLDEDFAFSDELKNILEPLSTDDDWMQDLSDAAGEEAKAAPTDELDEYRQDEPDTTDDNKAPKTTQKDKGKFYTPTLGEIYAAQGQYAKAISVYETLMKNDPENEWYQSKLDYLRKKLAEQQ